MRKLGVMPRYRLWSPGAIPRRLVDVPDRVWVSPGLNMRQFIFLGKFVPWTGMELQAQKLAWRWFKAWRCICGG